MTTRLQETTLSKSAVSHELRTPLASIKGFSSTLLEMDVSESERREFLTIIDQEADKLTRLIENLLDLSRAKSGLMVLNFEQVNVLEIISRVKLEVFDRNNEKKLYFEIESADFITGRVKLIKMLCSRFLRILLVMQLNLRKRRYKGKS